MSIIQHCQTKQQTIARQDGCLMHCRLFDNSLNYGLLRINFLKQYSGKPRDNHDNLSHKSMSDKPLPVKAHKTKQQKQRVNDELNRDQIDHDKPSSARGTAQWKALQNASVEKDDMQHEGASDDHENQKDGKQHHHQSIQSKSRRVSRRESYRLRCSLERSSQHAMHYHESSQLDQAKARHREWKPVSHRTSPAY